MFGRIKEQQPAAPTSTEPLQGVARALGVPDLDLEPEGQSTSQRTDGTGEKGSLQKSVNGLK